MYELLSLLRYSDDEQLHKGNGARTVSIKQYKSFGYV